MEKDLKSKRVSFSGEEVGVCHSLSLEQVLPSLPPKEHGGCIDILRFVSSSTKHFLTHPKRMIVKDVGQELPKLQGKLHIEKGSELPLARVLVDRGVCRWVPLEDVLVYRQQRVLNGLFGVEKPINFGFWKTCFTFDHEPGALQCHHQGIFWGCFKPAPYNFMDEYSDRRWVRAENLAK